MRNNTSWLQHIPKHWEVKRFKEIFSIASTGFTPDSKNADNFDIDEVGYTWITIADFTNKFVSKSNLFITQKVVDEYLPQLTEKGALMFSFKLSVGKVAFAEKDLYTNEAIMSISPRNKQNLNYFYYLLPIVTIENATENIYGAKMLNQKLIANMSFPLPPLPEQEKIAHYLDTKVGEIDQKVSLIEKKIERYQLLKKSIINKVVTKGLYPEAPLKDSQISWLGQIPAHWEVKRLRDVCQLNGRIGFRGYTNDDIVEDESDGAITLGPSNLAGMNMDYSHCKYLSWEKYYESPEIMVREGDIILAKTASVGKYAYVDYLPKETTVNPQLLVINNFDNAMPKYMAYNFASQVIDTQINYNVVGSTILTISQIAIGNFKFPLPPLSEQEEIVVYLNQKCADIDAIIANCTAQIEKYKTLKRALINEVVTGQRTIE